MSTVVRHEPGKLGIGDTRILINRDAFDDPALLAVISSGGIGQPVKLLRMLLNDEGYATAREVLASASGSPSENMRSIIQTIIQGECPELMTFIWMTSEYPAELAFDFKRFLSIDLDKARRKKSPRQLAKWAIAMPAEGSLHRAINPDWRWGLNEQLLAGVYDSLSFLRWEAAKLAGAKPGKTPDQLERPGVKPKRDVELIAKPDASIETIEEFDVWLAEKQAQMRPAIE